jgi:hypothetical protein
MATLTISSGVHVGTRDDSTDWTTWFEASPTTQFETFTLASTSATVSRRTGPQAITGHADLVGGPVIFQVDRRARDVITDSLAAVAVEDLLNGRPRTTLSGFRDAVARSGYLANVAWSERRNDGGTAESFSVWGVIQVTDASVRGLTESLQLTVWPCDLLWWTGTTSCYLSPAAYADLVEWE